MSSSLHRVAMATWICSQHSIHGGSLANSCGEHLPWEKIWYFSLNLLFLDTCWHQQTSLISKAFLLDGRWWVPYRNFFCRNGCHSPVETITCILLHVSNSWNNTENSNFAQLKGLCWLGQYFSPPEPLLPSRHSALRRQSGRGDFLWLWVCCG